MKNKFMTGVTLSKITKIFFRSILKSVLDYTSKNYISTIFILISVVFVVIYSDILLDVIKILDKIHFEIGNNKFSLYHALKSTIAFCIGVFFITKLSRYAKIKITKIKSLRNNRDVIIKLTDIFIYLVGTIILFQMVGIDMTSLTILSGTVGLGLGLGLQKIVSNFISGIIITMEKSIELDDIIEIDGVKGVVKKIGIRYTLLKKFDGHEVMVPNELIITNKLINWTLNDNIMRIDIAIHVSYESDLEMAQKIVLEIAKCHPRKSSRHEPEIFVANFGDFAIELLLVFWIDDVNLGIWGPKSDILTSVFKKFKENNIEIPYPKRELIIKKEI